MTNRNANKSSPGQPAGQGAASDAAPQPHPPPLPQQPSRGYDTPNFVPQEHPLLAQQRALSQDPRRRPDEGAPGPVAAPPVERAMPWGDPRPRRRQDREAGPSDKQVYVPPVTLPPNREHQAMDLQKIQVAPSLLKGVDERNRPTMRRIPVHGMPAPPGAPEGPGGMRPGGVRTARVGVGSGVWPPPEEPRKQRPHAAPAAQPVVAAPRPGMPPNAARPDPAAAAAAAALASRRRGAPLGLFALLVFLGSATVAGFWVLWRAANPPAAHDAARADEARGPAPEPSAATAAPSAPPDPPPPAVPPPVVTVEQPPPVAEQPPPPAAPDAPVRSATPAPSASHAHSAPVAATRPPTARPAPQAKRPPKPPTTPEDVYEPTANTPPSSPQPLPSVPAALPSAPPGTTAPPRPFP
ncbi:hypothetical protein [Sorangium sp. So ce1335]|uniref:hypothetical protein n=1 Tax=Sorangium sp. So ce1335 TaxID=3133335 RepID=UPI003F5DEAD0